MTFKLWIRKALTMCLTVAVLAAYSMVTLANSAKIVGDLTVIGNGEATYVLVNGESAKTGRSIFSSSTITTPESSSAIISLGKLGKLELSPNTTILLSFNEKGISGDLKSGKVAVLGSSDPVSITNAAGKQLMLSAGQSLTAAGRAQDDDDDDDDDDDGGAAWIIWAAVFGGALAGIVYATVSDNNNTALGGGVGVVSPSR
ncbi:MAG: hypothetical protein ACT4O9_06210 [Blastocatellia bacterium]